MALNSLICADVPLRNYSLTHSLTSQTPFTRYNRLYNRFDNRLYRVNKHPTGCQPVVIPFDNRFEMFVYTIQPVVNPVWQQDVSCKRCFRHRRRHASS